MDDVMNDHPDVQVESEQLIRARRAYTANTDAIRTSILNIAVDTNTSEWAFNNVTTGDGIFDPFYRHGEGLADFDSEYGNSDDQTQYMTSVWLDVLLNDEDPTRFLKLMRRLSDIQVNGL